MSLFTFDRFWQDTKRSWQEKIRSIDAWMDPKLFGRLPELPDGSREHPKARRLRRVVRVPLPLFMIGGLGGVTAPESYDSCRTYHSGSTSCTNNTWTAAACDSERFDYGGLHNTVTNNDRLTIPSRAGVYFFHLLGLFEANVTGYRSYEARHNGSLGSGGTQIGGGSFQAVTASGVGTNLFWSGLWEMAATDYVAHSAIQGSGSTINLTQSVFGCVGPFER